MISCTFIPEHVRKGADLFGDHLYNIINKNIRLLTARFRSILSEEDIEDLVHDTYVRIVLKRERYNPAGNFEGWVYRICRNSVYDCASQKGKRSGIRVVIPEDRDYNENLIRNDSAADYHIIQKEAEDRIWRGINRLKPAYKDVAVLLTDEATYEEMSAVLGCKVNAVKTRVCRTRQNLRTYNLVG